LQLFVEFLIVIEEHDKAAHLAFAVLGGGGVELLGQTGQGVAEISSEDHGDRVGAVRSDQAQGLGSEFARHVLDVERCPNGVSRLGAGLHGIRGHYGACKQRDGQHASYGNALFHRRAYLLSWEKRNTWNQRKIRSKHTPCAVVLGKKRHTECAYHNLIGLPYLDAAEKRLIQVFSSARWTTICFQPQKNRPPFRMRERTPRRIPAERR